MTAKALKWEYRVERIPIDNPQEICDFIHVAGMTGWELVAVLPTNDPPPFNRWTLAIYKRTAPIAPTQSSS
jgi:hypothetical protein